MKPRVWMVCTGLVAASVAGGCSAHKGQQSPAHAASGANAPSEETAGDNRAGAGLDDASSAMKSAAAQPGYGPPGRASTDSGEAVPQQIPYPSSGPPSPARTPPGPRYATPPPGTEADLGERMVDDQRTRALLDDFLVAESALMASASSCVDACRALRSMQRAARGLCELAESRSDRQRCEAAEARYRAARQRVRSACARCDGGPSLDPDAPVDDRR
jgi:hypothetical protein